MNLKELTIQQHRNAERQQFAGLLMSGSIPRSIYLRYLVNQHACYSALENHDLFDLPHKDLERRKKIQKDIHELNDVLKIDVNAMLTASTLEYLNHVKNIKHQNDFIAHVYVRYLGDLRGGQMIAKKIPGKGCYYNFQNPNELANCIYRLLNEDMADEAKKVFNFATRLFIEMYDVMLLENKNSKPI